MDCLFCKINNNEIPAKVIYENDYVKAFLDIFPASYGHVLVITKKHYVELKEIPDNELLELMKAVNKLYPIVKEVTNCDGIHLLENYGSAQEIKHVHFHIIPTFNDYRALNFNKMSDTEHLDKLHLLLQNKFNKSQD